MPKGWSFIGENVVRAELKDMLRRKLACCLSQCAIVSGLSLIVGRDNLHAT
jgi:hypothetical protein